MLSFFLNNCPSIHVCMVFDRRKKDKYQRKGKGKQLGLKASLLHLLLRFLLVLDVEYILKADFYCQFMDYMAHNPEGEEYDREESCL
jgi:hypothetical protein